MYINMQITDAVLTLTDEQINSILNTTLSKLNNWLKKEAVKTGAAVLKVVAHSQIKRRFLSFRKDKNTGNVKLWVGINPLGIHNFGNPKQSGSDVVVDKRYKDTFITDMDKGSDGKHVYYRDKTVTKRLQGRIGKDGKRTKGRNYHPLRMVVRGFDDEAEEVMQHLSLNVDEKFQELLGAEIDAVL